MLLSRANCLQALLQGRHRRLKVRQERQELLARSAQLAGLGLQELRAKLVQMGHPEGQVQQVLQALRAAQGPLDPVDLQSLIGKMKDLRYRFRMNR